ncbi:hypothetical protein HDU96_010903 [Phlyctochytrium bullatum]|nr:hypothetical protein HDU96_010903 [Phlyctochytrium bullatum]
MAEIVGATASNLIGEGKSTLRVNHIVTRIDYSADPETDPHPVHLHTTRGLYRCRTAIVTIPLGVLKHHHTTLLHPPLPAPHAAAIDRLGFGLIDKVILEFASSFWPADLDGWWAFMPPLRRGMDFDEGEDAPALVGFVNMERMHAGGWDPDDASPSPDALGATATAAPMEGVRLPGPPVLVAYVSQRTALRLERMEDGEVGDLFITLLASCFNNASAELRSVRVTRQLRNMEALAPKNVRSASRRVNKKGGLTLVIKLGTSSICDEKTYFPKLSNLSLMVETVVRLRSLGHAVVIVSSGAVGVGLKRLSLDRRPKHLPQVQAVAAVGQGRLMALYDDLFGRFDVAVAQILLTRDTIAERAQYLNACNTFKELLAMGVVPIVNENDTVSHAEIRFGDNDTLSAITAGMINADYLFLCTDVECLYTDNPRTNPDAKPVRVVEDIAKLREQITVSSPGSSLGTGGMVTKLIAADLATAAGCSTIITLGSKPQLILSILEELGVHASRVSSTDSPVPKPSVLTPPTATEEPPFEPTIGTHFLAKPNPMLDRKWWILHGLAPHGVLTIDAGAVRAVVRNRSSLFAAGVRGIEGVFSAQQGVKVVAAAKDVIEAGCEEKLPHGVTGDAVVEVGRGIVNYSSAECGRILGCRSKEIVERLGYMESEFLIHRDNLVVTLKAEGEV